jgi:hypothetical protein
MGARGQELLEQVGRPPPQYCPRRRRRNKRVSRKTAPGHHLGELHKGESKAETGHFSESFFL